MWSWITGHHPGGFHKEAIPHTDGNYFLDYYLGGRRVREWIGPNKRLAVTVMGKRRTEIAEGKHLDRRTVRRVTFRQYAEEYARVYSARKKSAKRDESSFKSLLPVFGDCYLDAITPEMVHGYQTNRLDQGKKPATVNRELALLKTLFNRAIEGGKAGSNPVAKVKFLKENNARCRILEPEERERLRAEMHPRICRIYDFARHTGLRQGEIFRLKWQDVDLRRGYLRVGEAKSGEGRTVPLNATARAILESIPYRLDGGFVFCRPQDGEAIQSIRTGFKRALRRGGIDDYRFHDSRHEFASALAMEGVDLNTIRELLGHKTMRMVMRYSHLTDRHKAQAVALLDGAEGSKIDTERLSCERPLV
ncbi:MAG: tyrosine-type recombinase/integrase [Nitrospinota bacterium]|nr:tyrosine-type recombinase/integrase [Nitrospinota bacterium]